MHIGQSEEIGNKLYRRSLILRFPKLPSLLRSDRNFLNYLTLKLEIQKLWYPPSSGFTPRNPIFFICFYVFYLFQVDQM